MFDMGFTELMLIGIVGLIVIGPERLPGVARTAGKYFGKLRRFMSNVKADVESELRADELREILNKQSDELESLKKVVNDVGKDLDSSVNQVEASVNSAVNTEGDNDTAKDWTESITPPQEETETASEPKASVEATSAEPDAAKPEVVKTKAAKPKATRAKSAKAKAKPKAKKVASK